MKVEVHQGSCDYLHNIGCPNPFLFIMVFEALSSERVVEMFRNWEDSMESKGLRVNVGKTKVMISGDDEGTVVASGIWPRSYFRIW